MAAKRKQPIPTRVPTFYLNPRLNKAGLPIEALESGAALYYLSELLGVQATAATQPAILERLSQTDLGRLSWLLHFDQLEAHYRDVALLDKKAVRSYLSRFDPDHEFRITYAKVLINGADPRLQLARDIVNIIPALRKALLEGDYPLLHLRLIDDAHERANILLIMKFAQSGIASAVGSVHGTRTLQQKAQKLFEEYQSAPLTEKGRPAVSKLRTEKGRPVSRTTIWRLEKQRLKLQQAGKPVQRSE